MGETPIDAAAATITELRALSQAMLAGARDGEWVTVANLETARAALLRELFEGASRPPPDMLAPLIEELLAGDRAILALAEPARERAGAEILSLNHGRRAQAAYAEAGAER